MPTTIALTWQSSSCIIAKPLHSLKVLVVKNFMDFVDFLPQNFCATVTVLLESTKIVFTKIMIPQNFSPSKNFTVICPSGISPLIMSCVQVAVCVIACDIITRSRNNLSTPYFMSFSPCLREYRRKGKVSSPIVAMCSILQTYIRVTGLA